MKDGKIQQFGTPTDIYDEPVNRFVADFIGESNIVEGKMVEDFVVNIYGQDFECVDAGIPSGKNVEVVIRPEDISLIEETKGYLKLLLIQCYLEAFIMKFVALIEKDMNGSYRQLKSRSWKRSRTLF